MAKPKRTAAAHVKIDALDRFFLEYGYATEDLRPTWEACREAITAEFVAEHPGERPWAWWEWEAVEPRDASRETETHYLQRLGLLLPGEAEAIEAKRSKHNEPS